MDNNIHCDLCEQYATSHVKWGTKSEQEGNFCTDHCSMLWEQCKTGVTVGNLIWIQGPVSGIKVYADEN